MVPLLDDSIISFITTINDSFIKERYLTNQDSSHDVLSAAFGKKKQSLNFCTQCVFKSIKMKTYVALIAHNLKALYTEPASKFSNNLEKF